MFRVSCFLILAWTALTSDAAYSAEKSTPSPRPSAPKIEKANKIPENPFKCDRMIIHRGRTLPCDSALRRDGESLRHIMESTPSAIDELERYQSGRNAAKYTAYIGTTGLVLALFGGTLANLFISEDRSLARRDVSKVSRFTGIGLVAGSVVFGLSQLRQNEDHLHQAIHNYNTQHPDRPIQVLFKTEF